MSIEKIFAFIGISVVTLLAIGVAVYNYQSTIIKECTTEAPCVLSKCDCKCYPAGETPEEKENLLCGTRCDKSLNITGCSCEKNLCKEVIVQ